MKRFFLILLIALFVSPVVEASHDDDDKRTVIERGIRRLHPERERAKAQKKLMEQMSRKAEQKSDPWDTSDEVWGTVDIPPVMMMDSTAMAGRRLMPGGADDVTRVAWRDEPITVPLEQLMLSMIVDDGEYRSKYVSSDSVSNEVYFAFTIPEGDSLPGPLRLCVHYCDDVQIDCDQVTFTIDGYDYLFYPSTTRYGVTTDGQHWAACDDDLHSIHRDLVYALSHGKWGMVKFNGIHGMSRVKMLTDGQMDDFACTLSLYLLLGGEM